MNPTQNRAANKKGQKKADRKRKIHNRERDHQPSSTLRRYREQRLTQMTSPFDQLFVPNCPAGYR